MTHSNVRGHCFASMALLIKQTFYPHNSNVWTERGRGDWVRVPSADRLVAPDKYEGIGNSKLGNAIGHSIGKTREALNCLCLILAGINFSSHFL